MHYFHTKLTYQKRMLRQIEWWVQNRPITMKGVLPVTTLFFSKFCFSLRTSHYKELIWFTNDANVYIHTFCKRSRFFFWQRFSPVSILNVKSLTYYFHMRTKILADFQICIIVPLIPEIFKENPFTNFECLNNYNGLDKDEVFSNFEYHWVIAAILR